MSNLGCKITKYFVIYKSRYGSEMKKVMVGWARSQYGGGKKCMHNISGEISWKTAKWQIEKWMGEKNQTDLRDTSCEDGGVQNRLKPRPGSVFDNSIPENSVSATRELDNLTTSLFRYLETVQCTKRL